MCTQVNASDNGYRMLIERPPASSALGEHNDNEILAIILGGTVLATLSGFVNAVSVSGTFSVGVSHVTGSVTRMGVSSVSGRYDEFWEFTGLVLVFMFGAFVSGCIIRDRAFALGRSYGVVLVIEAIVLIIAAIVYEELKSFVSEYFMAFACGLQNAMTTSYSGAVLRTTHLSGLVTDIGSITAQWVLDGKASKDKWKLQIFVPLLFGFLVGTFCGSYAHSMLGAYALWIPSSLFLFAALAYMTNPYVRSARVAMKREAERKLGDLWNAFGERRALIPTLHAGAVPTELQLVSVQDQTDNRPVVSSAERDLNSNSNNSEGE
ncbi:unnamed protein product (mitochondrion) [Plasmodiophora brassicae]|uniref:DUF1275 domain-containing protein n=2 Tax=Plasmodiophora brassicae TaxID=37360 RepID=A0A3P3YNW5_PLABS|nr:unnamed protein product [Plasmodiophora brassicae]